MSADANLVPKGGTVTLVARSRLFWWLFGGMGLLLFALSGGLGFLLLEQMERFEFQQVEENLHFQATQVERELQQLSPNGMDLSPQTVADQYRNTPLRLTILDGSGRVLADSAVTPPPVENHSDRPELVAAQRDGSASFIHVSRTIGGSSMVYVAHRVQGAPTPIAFVRFSRSLDSIQAELTHLRLVAWALGGLATLAALGLAFTLARGVVQPLQALTRGADQIAAGAFGHQIRLKQRNEIGSLAQAFNTMSHQLARQFAQVEKDRQTLRAVFGGMVEGVVALDSEQRILFVNERAGQLLGFSAEAAIGQKLERVVSHPTIQSLAQKANAVSEPEDTEFVWNAPGERRLSVHLAPLPNCAFRRHRPRAARHD